MQGKQLHDFLFDLYTYADTIADRITPGGIDNEIYFLTLVHIEKIFDSYGRGLVYEAAEDANDASLDPRASLSEANERINQLRRRIWELAQEYDFDDALARSGESIANRWHEPSTE